MADNEGRKAFAPGSIGNLACGFDVFGLALDGPGDTVEARKATEGGLRIVAIHGDDGRIPMDVQLNTAGAAVSSLLEETGYEGGMELELWKGLPLAGGMGGSAASAVAAVVAVNDLIGAGLGPDRLLHHALIGETKGAGAPSPDNAAPALLGGIVLVPAWDPIRAVGLEAPHDLWAAHVHPHLEVETQGARAILGDTVPLRAAVTQWGNTAAFVTGLFREDWDLISRSVEDHIAEPRRAPAVPGFASVKAAALRHGALASSLSGSGPSVFALCRGRDRAEEVGRRMVETFQEAAGVGSDLLVSHGRAPGARLLST